MRWIICLCAVMAGLALGVGPSPARADQLELSEMPAAARRAIARDMEAYLDQATEVIAGYGTDGRLDAAGLALMADAARAKARALALVPLGSADLNGDGALAEAEVAALAPILSASARGRLERAYQRAETDGTPGLSAAELAAFARAAGEAAVSAAEVARMQGLLAFDRDGDGGVTRAEVKAGLEAMARQAGEKGI